MKKPVNRVSQSSVESARALAARLPDLLVDARHIAASVLLGVHGRRRPGPGETFWQFRPYVFGESAKRIDWRRSARDHQHLYVREREWEAAQTIWLWADLSPSMLFCSQLSQVPKIERAIVLLLALADLLGRGGERLHGMDERLSVGDDHVDLGEPEIVATDMLEAYLERVELGTRPIEVGPTLSEFHETNVGYSDRRAHDGNPVETLALVDELGRRSRAGATP